MTETPVNRLICRLALPCIISMLVTSFYNMADTFFVGMLKRGIPLRINEAYEHAAILPCPGEDSGCNKIVTQCVDVTAPVTLVPTASLGTVTVACQGVPVVNCVTDPSPRLLHPGRLHRQHPGPGRPGLSGGPEAPGGISASMEKRLSRKAAASAVIIFSRST